MDSKEYSWAWVTEDRLLSRGPCELVSAIGTSSSGTGTFNIYNGESVGGNLVARVEVDTGHSSGLVPPVPVYCNRGLFIDVYEKCHGILVQWRELPSK